ncbi:MAG: hypothetical protein Q9159_000987 [Coniocarpon cinnabarinum]
MASITDGDQSCQQPQQTFSKRRAPRATRACDFCHSRSIRCRQPPSVPGVENSSANPGECQNCVEYQRPCTYTRPLKKRGAQSNRSRNAPKPAQSSSSDAVAPAFRAPDIISDEAISNLIDIYFETIYPIFPIFHRQTLYRRVGDREYATDASFFSCVIALVSLTVSRIRDGGVFSARWKQYDISLLPSGEKLADVADSLIPKDGRAGTSLDFQRSVSLLTLRALQNGATKDMQMWMGIYHMFVRVSGLHVEDNWPSGIALIELEERRRLFWSMYTLDVLSATCFGTPVPGREDQIQVHYPREYNDEQLESMAATGWDDETSTEISSEPADMKPGSTWVQDHMLQAVLDSHESLSPVFKTIPHITFDQSQDIFGFQAANIAATMQLVRIALHSPSIASVTQRCHIITEVVQTFIQVPLGFLKAISAPLIFHLGGIGLLLECSVETTPYPDLLRYRVVLTGLADLISYLGKGTLIGDGPAEQVRGQIAAVESRMAYLESTEHISYPRPKPDSLFHLPSRLYIPPGPDSNSWASVLTSNTPSTDMSESGMMLDHFNSVTTLSPSTLSIIQSQHAGAYFPWLEMGRVNNIPNDWSSQQNPLSPFDYPSHPKQLHTTSATPHAEAAFPNQTTFAGNPNFSSNASAPWPGVFETNDDRYLG